MRRVSIAADGMAALILAASVALTVVCLCVRCFVLTRRRRLKHAQDKVHRPPRCSHALLPCSQRAADLAASIVQQHLEAAAAPPPYCYAAYPAEAPPA